MSRNKVRLSDHALIRYIERRYNIDLDVYRDEILTKDNITAIKKGATAINVGGVSLQIKNNTIVTVLNTGQFIKPKGV